MERPRRSIKTPKRFTYDQMGGGVDEGEREDSDWGSDVENIGEIDEVLNNPYDSVGKNEYNIEWLADSDITDSLITEDEEDISTEDEDDETEDDIEDLLESDDTDDEIDDDIEEEYSIVMV